MRAGRGGVWAAAVCVVVLIGAPVTAGAQDTTSGTAAGGDILTTVATAIAERGWYADPGLTVDAAELDGVVAGMEEASGQRIGFALLAESAPLPPHAFASNVLGSLRRVNDYTTQTVVTVAPVEVQLASNTWSLDELEDALSTAPDPRSDPPAGLVGMAEALERRDATMAPTTDDDTYVDLRGRRRARPRADDPVLWIAAAAVVALLVVGEVVRRRRSGARQASDT